MDGVRGRLRPTRSAPSRAGRAAAHQTSGNFLGVDEANVVFCAWTPFCLRRGGAALAAQAGNLCFRFYFPV